jgi:UDP-N-acetylmuramate dehydrogenase
LTVAEGDIKELFGSKAIGAGIRFGEPMARHTWLRIGGPAEAFVTPRDVESLGRLVRAARKAGVPVLAVGGGSNLLVMDGGIEGLTVSMAALDSMEVSEEAPDGVLIAAGAGLPLQRLLEFARERGLSGLEGLAGIPGQVGGATAGNAGAFGFELKDVVSGAMLMDQEGRLTKVERAQMGFRYRGASVPGGSIILSVELRLERDDPAEVAGRMERFLREKRRSQPLGSGSAGCVFKNPQGHSAGKLIDEAGCKGMRQGEIEVSRVHANFFINTGGGTADDFLRLMDRVASMVKHSSGVVLEPEIRVVGKC